MLCLAGLVPVENDDQATGEPDGKVVFEWRIAARLGQLFEVGQLALLHEPIGELGVLPIEPDDDQPLDERFAGPLPPPSYQLPQHAERPSQKRQDGDDDGREDHEERGDDGDPGARANIGLGGDGKPDKGEQGRQCKCDPHPPITILMSTHTAIDHQRPN